MQKSPLFAALLTPYRSLGLTGIRGVVALYAVLAMVPGIYFYLAGAWPVVGFLGLDAVVLYWALSVSLKSGDAFEEITLWRDSLDIRHVNAKGRETNHSFNPFWVRLEVDRDFEARVTHLRIASREHALEIGAFLTPDDKNIFAGTFSQALYRAKN